MVIGELEEATLWSLAPAGGREELEQLDQRLIAISPRRSRFQLARTRLTTSQASAACSSLAALRLHLRSRLRRPKCPM